MRIFSHALVLFLCLSKTVAQNYQPFGTKSKIIFNNDIGFQVDSFDVESADTVLYMSKYVVFDWPLGYPMCGSLRSELFGDSPRLNDSSFTVFNKGGDTLVIPFTIPPGDSSDFLMKNDTVYFLYVDSIVFSNVPLSTLSDSIKHFSFGAFDTTGNKISTQWDTVNFRCSKSYGILDPVLFYHFPNDTVNTFDSLKSIVHLDAGQKMYQYKDFADSMNVGDEIHVWEQNLAAVPNWSRTIKERRIILEKNYKGDTIEYITSRDRYIDYQDADNNPPDSIGIIKDTISWTFIYSELKWLEVVPGIQVDLSFSYNAKPNGYDKRDFTYYEKWLMPNRICESNSAPCGFISGGYWLGIGGPWRSNCGFDGYTYRPVYWKLSGSEHGTPYDFSTLLNIKQRESIEIRISPNPVKNVIHINGLNSNIMRLEIIDVVGRLRRTFVNLQENSTFSIVDFEEGMYILNFYGKKGELLKNHRIIKH